MIIRPVISLIHETYTNTLITSTDPDYVNEASDSPAVPWE